MASELAFIFSNYVVHVVVARLLGVEAYGVFGVLLSLFMINRAFLNTGISRATSKFIAENPADGGTVFRVSWKLQLSIAFGFMLLYIVGAPLLANLLNDSSLKHYIILIGVIILPLALLSLYTSGLMNGLRLFKEQAIVKAAYPFLRVILTVLFILLGWGIFGVLIGYLISIVVGVLWAVYLVGKSSYKAKYNFVPGLNKKILLFALPVALSALSFSLLRNVNTLFIKYFFGSNAVVGLYTAAFTISTIPYFILISLSLTLTPAISNAASAGNIPLVQKYINQSLRLLLLILAPSTVLIAASSSVLLHFFYSASYAAGGPLLSILIFGSAFLTMFTTLTTITTGGGKPWIEMLLSIILMAVLALGNLILIPRYGLVGSTYAVLLTSMLACICIAVIVYRKYGTLGNGRSYFRIIGVSIFLFYLAHWWNASGWFLLIEYALLGILYFLLLFLFGEITADDWLFLRKLLRRAPADPGDDSA